MPSISTNPQDYIGFTFVDRVYGYEGVCTIYSVHLTGCDRVSLARLSDKGVPDPGWTFDITSVDKVDDVPQVQIEAIPSLPTTTGGAVKPGASMEPGPDRDR